MKTVTLTVDGKERTAICEKVGNTLWLNIDGQLFDYKPQRRSSGTSESVSDPTMITAPMPGKITKILAGKGDSVSKDQALVVMEAMKMEYTLKSQMDGTVEELNVEVNDQVDLGTLLIRVSE